MEWIRFWLEVRALLAAILEALAFMAATPPGLLMLLVTAGMVVTCVVCEIRQRRRS